MYGGFEADEGEEEVNVKSLKAFMIIVIPAMIFMAIVPCVAALVLWFFMEA